MRVYGQILLLSIISIGLLCCGNGGAPKTGASTMNEMTLTEQNHGRLVKARPAPVLNDSLERANLIKYLKYWNNPNRLSYLYLFSRSGTVLAHYVIVGKISYCRSKLTTREQLVRNPFGFAGSDNNRQAMAIESPGLDGSYGPSEDAIFFFTAENPGVPLVYRGDYIVSGVPLQLTTKPVLIREIK